MIEKMESKIENHVKSILKKDSIDFYDYQILVGEINRQHSKEKEAKQDAINKAQHEQMLKALGSMVCCCESD